MINHHEVMPFISGSTRCRLKYQRETECFTILKNSRPGEQGAEMLPTQQPTNSDGDQTNCSQPKSGKSYNVLCHICKD